MTHGFVACSLVACVTIPVPASPEAITLVSKLRHLVGDGLVICRESWLRIPGGETVGVPRDDFYVLLERLPCLSVVHNRPITRQVSTRRRNLSRREEVAKCSQIDRKVEPIFCKSYLARQSLTAVRY